MSLTHGVFIGLGANLNDPVSQILSAIDAIKSIPETELVKVSSLYGSKPLGPMEQPDYVNAIAELATHLSPHTLLANLQKIEIEQGRVRKEERWGPRTLDLDVILFGELVLDTETLTIPHYHFRQREFVLYPLAEIAPDLVLPNGESLQKIAAGVDRKGLERLNIAHS